MPRVVDLFCGAGLFSYAFAREGFELVFAVEHDTAAAKTYALNLGNHVVVGDVRGLTPDTACEVLIAGPPCQGFSTLGKRDPSDPRNNLSLEVARWADVLCPSVVVVENVEAFLTTKAWKKLAGRLRRSGYIVSSMVLNSADYGVAQYRRRSFTFGVRSGTVVEPPRHSLPTTVREAWTGLSPSPDGVNGHVAPRPSELALKRMSLIPPGGDKRDILANAPDLAPPSWSLIRNEAVDVWGRMEWDRPANTLRTCFQNPSKGRYIHPEQDRVISLREAARLQSIPDEFKFEGKPTQIARQIGNGVPVGLGRAIAGTVRRLLAA